MGASNQEIGTEIQDENPSRRGDVFTSLSLFAITGIAIAPFMIYRLLQRDWLIGTLDFAAVTLMVTLFVYSSVTRRTEIPNIIFCLFCVFIVNATVSIKGASQVYWSYPAIMMAFYLTRPHQALGIVALTLVLLVYQIWPMMDATTLATTLMTLASTYFLGYIFSSARDKQARQLAQVARVDPLTGAGNRLALKEKLEEVTSLFNRDGAPVSVILIDIDHFKEVNDTYGHDVGDDVLSQLAKYIGRRIRKSDSLFRYGGEEFVVVTSTTGRAGAALLAEDLRQGVHSVSLIEHGTLTISAGVAEYLLGEVAERWLRRADSALYDAKHSGRDKVCVAADDATVRMVANNNGTEVSTGTVG